MKKFTPADFQATTNASITLNGKYNMNNQKFENETIKWGTRQSTTQGTQYTNANGYRLFDTNMDSFTD